MHCRSPTIMCCTSTCTPCCPICWYSSSWKTRQLCLIRLYRLTVSPELSCPWMNRSAKHFGKFATRYTRQGKAISMTFRWMLCNISTITFKTQNLCVNTIIDKFDISGPTLQKIVKKAANTTFSGYVEAKRLSLAYMLLSSSNIGIQEIAERCGFSSSNSFYKVFKRKYTFSPSSVRDENAERKSAEK